MKPDKSEKVNEAMKRKTVQDDVKLRVKKQLKGFSYQVQLNLMEAIRSLMNYGEEVKENNGKINN